MRFAAKSRVDGWRVETLLTKEPATIAWIDAMPEDAVFWDVGANIGIYSIYAAARVKGIDVVAVEPVAQHFATLCEAIEANDFGLCIIPVCMALNDLYGNVRLGKLYAPAITLDGLEDLLSTTDPPTHIKIDTDGFDLAVLRGASRALRHAKSVIVEVDESRDDASTIRDLMAEAGFTRTGRHVSPLFPNSPIGMDHWARTQENL